MGNTYMNKDCMIKIFDLGIFCNHLLSTRNAPGTIYIIIINY